MSTNVRIILDKRRQKSDKTYPLILRIVHYRKSTSIPLDYSILEKDWNETDCAVKKSSQVVSNVTRLNNYLLKQKTNAIDIINQLEDSGEIHNLSVGEIKDRILNKATKISFFTYTKKVITELKAIEKFGNAKVYQGTFTALKTYRNKVDFSFYELNYNFLKRFEAYCIKRKNSTNSISVHMRTIRALYNRAIKEGYAKQEFYPFRKYKIPSAKTKKRAVRKEVIERIEELNLKKDTRIWHAKNYFLFSFYNMGLNFTDLAQLKKKNIVDGRIEYARSKTGREYSIKITPKSQSILKLYLRGKKADDYIFPIIQRKGNPELEYRDMVDRRRVYNKQLKEIATLAKIETNLTSYVSRHSWATEAKRKGVPTAVISEGLGHESETTTQIYLDSFDKEVLDDYNEIITG